MNVAQNKPLVAILERTSPISHRLLLAYDDIEVAAKYMRDNRDLFKFGERHFNDKDRPPLVQWLVNRNGEAAKPTGKEQSS